MSIIEAVHKSVLAHRTDESFNRFLQTNEKIMSNFEDFEPRPRRIRQRSNRLDSSVVMETLVERHIEVDDRSEVD